MHLRSLPPHLVNIAVKNRGRDLKIAGLDAVGPHEYQLLRIFYRQRTEQNGIDQTEDGRVRSNAQSQ